MLPQRTSGLGAMLSARLSSHVRWLIASYLLPGRKRDLHDMSQERGETPGRDLHAEHGAQPNVCETCGDFGIYCPCWRSLPFRSYPLQDVYELGLWCVRCHERRRYTYCQCWRVRQLTRCQQCHSSLDRIKQGPSFSRPCARRCTECEGMLQV